MILKVPSNSSHSVITNLVGFFSVVGLWRGRRCGSGPSLLLQLLSLKAILFLTSEMREAKTGIRLCDGNKAKTVTVFAY